MKNYFNKILLLNSMSNDIAAFGEQQGSYNLFEKVDLSCGAIPEGEFEQIIDPFAPQEFLNLYFGIVHYRFAFAVTELLKLNEGYINPLKKYCYDQGKALGNCNFSNAKEVYSYINSVILDSKYLEENKQILCEENFNIEWVYSKNTITTYWDKCSCNISIFYELLIYFVNGILDQSSWEFYIDSSFHFIVGNKNNS